MQKIALCLLACFLFFSAQAQVNKGRLYAGGTALLTISTYNPSVSTSYRKTETYFAIAPSAGYFITDKVALGITSGYGKRTEHTLNPNFPLDSQRVVRNSFETGVCTSY